MENLAQKPMKKFYESWEVPAALDEFTDCENGPIPDQNHLRYQGLGRCWIWTGDRNNCNYGTIPIRGRRLFVHRVNYMNKFGDIPYKMCVLHQCDNPLCVNPHHLRLGTHADNMRELAERRRHLVDQTSKKAKRTAYMREYMKSYREKKALA